MYLNHFGFDNFIFLFFIKALGHLIIIMTERKATCFEKQFPKKFLIKALGPLIIIMIFNVIIMTERKATCFYFDRKTIISKK